MLEFKIWNPGTQSSPPNQFDASLLTTLSAGTQGGNLGHFTLTVIVKGLDRYLERIKADFPALTFDDVLDEPTTGKQEVQLEDGSKEEINYPDKMVKAISVTNSFWPDDQVTHKDTFKSFLGLGGQKAAVFSNSRKDRIAESFSGEQAIIHHYKGSKQHPKKSKREEIQWSKQQKMYLFEAEIKDLDREIRSLQREYTELFSKYPQTSFAVIDIKRVFTEDHTPDSRITAESCEKLEDKIKEQLAVRSDKETYLFEIIFNLSNMDLNIEIKRFLEKVLEHMKQLNEHDANQDPYSLSAERDTTEALLAIELQELTNALKLYPELNSKINIIENLNKNLIDISNDLNTADALQSTLSKINTQLSTVTKERNEKEAKAKQLDKDIKQLELEIDKFERTIGKDADRTFTMPTSESGQTYHIDEELVLAEMVRQRINARYDLCGNNCARNVKTAIMAGINYNLQQEILKLPGVSKDFFATAFIDLPGRVYIWIDQLSKCLDTLNNRVELRNNSSNQP